MSDDHCALPQSTVGEHYGQNQATGGRHRLHHALTPATGGEHYAQPRSTGTLTLCCARYQELSLLTNPDGAESIKTPLPQIYVKKFSKKWTQATSGISDVSLCIKGGKISRCVALK